MRKTSTKFEIYLFKGTRSQKSRRNYDPAMLEKAVNEVLNGSLTSFRAAAIYNLPDTTIRDRVKRARREYSPELNFKQVLSEKCK